MVQDAEMLVHTFVTLKLDYCNALLAGCPSVSINKLPVVQNVAARKPDPKAMIISVQCISPCSFLGLLLIKFRLKTHMFTQIFKYILFRSLGCVTKILLLFFFLLFL